MPREEKGNETGKVVIVHGSVEPAKRHQFVDDESKETEAKRTETCVAPRHACRCLNLRDALSGHLLFCFLCFVVFIVRDMRVFFIHL